MVTSSSTTRQPFATLPGVTTPTGRTGSSAQSSLSPRPAGTPARRLRRRAALAAAGTVAVATAGLAVSGVSSAATAARTRPATNTVFVSAAAAVPGTHADFAIGRNGTGKTTVWRYTGSAWKTVKFSLSSSQFLTGVAATSSSHAWLVGQSETSKGTATLMAAWNGSSFKVQGGAIKNAAFNGITGNASGAWAWGSQTVGDGVATLLEHWNGHSWVKASTKGIAEGTEIAQMATAGSSAWILGTSSLGGSSSDVLLRWSGSSWKSTSFPGAKNESQIISSLSASGASSAVVGGYVSSSSGSKGIALHWNGSKWSSYNLPKDMFPMTAAAVGGSAWLGGYRSTGSLAGVASIVRWTGHSFALVSLAGTGDKFSDIQTIAANSPTDAVALGARGTNACDPTNQLFDKLSGSKWSRQGATLPQLAAAGIGPHC
jgi:hypothetical protein